MLSSTLAGLLLLALPGEVIGQQGFKDPHRPACKDARCQKIKAYIQAHYCEAPVTQDGIDYCYVPHENEGTGNDVAVIASYSCESGGDRCQWKQSGQPAPQIKATLLREMRQLGQPRAGDQRTYFTVWKSKSAGWTLAEGLHYRWIGYPFPGTVTVCQVFLIVDRKSQVTVLHTLPFQETDENQYYVTQWTTLDIADADGDGQPEVILRGDAYENHWFEVFSFENGSARMIFSGLGYNL